MILTSTARDVPYLLVLVGRSDWGVLAITTERFSTRKARKIAIRGSKRAKSSSRGSWPVDGGTWPPRARCMARTALCQGGQRLALPHSRPMLAGRTIGAEYLRVCCPVSVIIHLPLQAKA